MFFRDKLATPVNREETHSPQIFRGISALLWKGQHSAGCLRHFTVFNHFRAIPEYCFDCCKVLIEPRTVLELFKLLMSFEKLELPGDNTRKCMCESRNYCSGAYKGFIYCRGIDEAKEIYAKVRKVITDDISSEVPVSLKRGCSEFELAYPGYSRIETNTEIMQYRKEWRVHEDFVDSNAVFTAPPDVKINKHEAYTAAEIYAMHYWLAYAATIGDVSYLKVAGRPVSPIPQLKRPPFGGRSAD